ncbi:MAG: hypothetical protein M0036_12715 [Desulfobacteraceae bacterium]|nr:hypothetical protein [Desulfobacteraceae bacterium]
MTMTGGVNDLPPTQGEAEKESEVQWADEYGPKSQQEAEPPQDWQVLLNEMMAKIMAQGEEAKESAFFARLLNAGHLMSQLNQFWNSTIQDLPKLYQGNGDSAQSKEIINKWIERYKNIFKEEESPLSQQAEEIFSFWLHMTQMSQTAHEPVWNHWLAALPQWNEQSEKLAKGDLEALDERLSLWKELYNETLGKFLRMPALGLTKQHTEKITGTFAEFAQLMSSLPYLYQYLYNTEIEAFKEVFDRIHQLDLKEMTPEAMREIYKIWLTTNEKTFHRLFKQPDFCNTMGEVLNCMFRFKKQMNDLTAKWCEAMSIPSGRDHDQMAMAIQDLRRKVHAQQKTISALQQKLARHQSKEAS